MLTKLEAHETMDQLLEGCQIIGPDWRYRYVNDAAARQGRRSKTEFIGRAMEEVYPGIERSPMFAVLRQCMADRTPRQMENEFTFPDGSIGWFDLRFEPVPEGIFILSLDITDRKAGEAEQQMILEALQLINETENWETLLKSLLRCLKRWSRCEAAGIRIKDGVDFPYFATSGFSEDFVRHESHLCIYGPDGAPLRDAQGKPLLECMCGNILNGRFDPSKNFFTTDGSFWSNCTTELLATTSDADRRVRTRNRCNSVGYESVALIPLRSGGETFGLIQLNDHQPGRFTPEGIALFRRIADHVAGFLARKKVENRIVHLNAVLRGVRNVNHLITREKNPNELIQKACELLVETGGFHCAVVGLADESGQRIERFAGAGEALDALRQVLARGEMPDCARRAMAEREMVPWHNFRMCAGGCSQETEAGPEEVALVISLENEGRCYGFLMGCLPGEMGEDIEGQGLLEETAGDIAFALHSIEMKADRDRSAAALAEAKDQLRQAQKLEAVGQLAGGVAHDFNNILMAQIGYCDLIGEALKAGDPLARDIDQIKACANRAAALTRQLLAFSRKQTLQPKVLDLNAVVVNIEKMLRRLIGEDITCRMTLADGLARVKADRGQIEQVIMNLAVNARDAMPDGGRLTIHTADVLLDEAYASQHVGVKPGPYVMLAIGDTGCGMDAETKRRVFEPFFTTKGQGKGTGLGLATVYGIVKQSGGNVWVYSELGRGTIFKIYLPAIAAESPGQGKQETPPANGKGELILVVEDDPALRTLFARMIGNLGYRVKVAGNGTEALNVVKDDGLHPDLMITDVVMPGMNGRVLAQQLGKVQPGLRVLYTSGYTDNAIVHHGVAAPNTPFLQKPFNVTDLATKIHELLCSPAALSDEPDSS